MGEGKASLKLNLDMQEGGEKTDRLLVETNQH